MSFFSTPKFVLFFFSFLSCFLSCFLICFVILLFILFFILFFVFLLSKTNHIHHSYWMMELNFLPEISHILFNLLLVFFSFSLSLSFFFLPFFPTNDPNIRHYGHLTLPSLSLLFSFSFPSLSLLFPLPLLK